MDGRRVRHARSGLVRAKNTTEILTKNILLYAIACIMFLLVGYNIMYVDNSAGGWLPSFGSLMAARRTTRATPLHSDFFFQVVFVATATSIISGAVAERDEALVLPAVLRVMTGSTPWKATGAGAAASFSDFAGSGIVHLVGAAAALAAVLLLGPVAANMASRGDLPHPRLQPAARDPGHPDPLDGLVRLQRWLPNWRSPAPLTPPPSAPCSSTPTPPRPPVWSAPLLVSKLTWGKADLTMILNGALGGLVAITADPASPARCSPALIGALAGAPGGLRHRRLRSPEDR